MEKGEEKERNKKRNHSGEGEFLWAGPTLLAVPQVADVSAIKG
jgi:hypothetical protein